MPLSSAGFASLNPQCSAAEGIINEIRREKRSLGVICLLAEELGISPIARIIPSNSEYEKGMTNFLFICESKTYGGLSKKVGEIGATDIDINRQPTKNGDVAFIYVVCKNKEVMYKIEKQIKDLTKEFELKKNYFVKRLGIEPIIRIKPV